MDALVFARSTINNEGYRILCHALYYMRSNYQPNDEEAFDAVELLYAFRTICIYN